MQPVKEKPINMKDVIFYAKQFSRLNEQQLQETLEDLKEKALRLTHRDYRPQFEALKYVLASKKRKVA